MTKSQPTALRALQRAVFLAGIACVALPEPTYAGLFGHAHVERPAAGEFGVGPRGRPVEDATIAVDGGMPEHGHGLPTQPRVRRSLGAGVYEIEGVRFSMGGWWELRLAIESAAGPDRVTFNLSL